MEERRLAVLHWLQEVPLAVEAVDEGDGKAGRERPAVDGLLLQPSQGLAGEVNVER
jgi:hypothetical protein